jgi:hypothetical protein
MLAKILISIGVFFYAVMVPIFEINNSHVFNPHWEAHARLHEVWQLFSNCAFGAFGLWLTWRKNNIRLAAVLNIIVTGGFLLAYFLRDFYQGSMVLSDGSEKTILGMNLGLVAYSLVIMLAMMAVCLQKHTALNPRQN